ncbi:MAG: hypothetical protein B7Y73_07795 [Acidocella sp. 35-58-6]|nr:MAG: hypothetical protein B7Y73_07795 [Acidocella sp. 35-58-6]
MSVYLDASVILPTLIQEAASAAGASTALGSHATDIFQKFVTEGHGGTDFSGIINNIRDKSA